MTKYRVASSGRCPSCRRYPDIRFSEESVSQAKRMRQGQHIQEVTCGCGRRYWLQARDLAAATPRGNGATAPTEPTGWPEGFTPSAVGALSEAGITTMEALLAVEDWTTIPGIGQATDRKMRAAMAAQRA